MLQNEGATLNEKAKKRGVDEEADGDSEIRSIQFKIAR